MFSAYCLLLTKWAQTVDHKVTVNVVSMKIYMYCQLHDYLIFILLFLIFKDKSNARNSFKRGLFEKILFIYFFVYFIHFESSFSSVCKPCSCKLLPFYFYLILHYIVLIKSVIKVYKHNLKIFLRIISLVN